MKSIVGPVPAVHGLVLLVTSILLYIARDLEHTPGLPRILCNNPVYTSSQHLRRFFAITLTMHLSPTSFVSLISLAALATGLSYNGELEKQCCLSDEEALNISTRWLRIFSTNGIDLSTDRELSTIVSPNIASYDDTFGTPTYGIDELYAAITTPGNTTTTDVRQFPLFVVNTCDQIAVRWEYNAITTGYKSSVSYFSERVELY